MHAELTAAQAATASITERQQAQRRPDRLLSCAIGAAILLGILVRAVYVISADFPLNDGGLFYTMIEELQQSGYRLPAFTSYNAAGIPYAYPPFGFYVAALVDDLTPLTRLDVLRYVPLVVSCLAIVAFFFLARAFLGMNWTLVGALLAFGLLPSGFIWLITGGGVTRAWGMLLAILSLHQASLLYTRRNPWFILTTSLCLGLTALSHIGTLPFLGLSLFLLFVAYGRTRQALLGSVLAVIGAALIAAPWFAAVLATHGLEPFLAARSTGMSIFSADAETQRYVLGLLARFGVGSAMGGSTGEPLFPVIGVLALLGVVASLTPARLVFPLWWLITILFESRGGYTYTAIPVAMLAGIGITDVLLPVLLRPAGPRAQASLTGAGLDGRGDGPRLLDTGGRRLVVIGVFGFLLGYAVLSTMITSPSLPSATRFLVSLTPEERAAMEWVAEHTQPSSRFLVVPESEWSQWQTDKSAEWFPALARRAALATVQGSEWLHGDQGFLARRKSFKELLKCVNALPRCLDDWAAARGLAFTHIYIPQPPTASDDPSRLCCQLLIRSLKEDPRYTVIYEKPGAIVFARKS